MSSKLSIKQKRFADEYIISGNATEAAIKAGYAKRSARVMASENLTKPNIKRYIDKRLKEIDDAKIVDLKEAMEYLSSVVRGESLSEVVVVEGTGRGRSRALRMDKAPDERERLRAADMLLKRYDVTQSVGLVAEEQRLRVEKLKAEVEAIKRESGAATAGPDYTGIPATMIAPTFAPVLFDIQEQEYMEYVFPGGRGSTKSSFVSLSLIDLIMTNETTHAVVMRQVADTLRSSVYQQVLWAIDMLGLTETFHATVSPMEITRKDTGQKIYFRGADDPGKIKSIKVPFGHIGILWFEELDQFAGPEAVRKVEQSVIRGGDTAYIFKSYNPPKSSINWVNKYVQIPKANRLVAHSNYLEVPKKWLGKPFLEEAEFLKENNRLAYDNEYMGEVNGIGGLVFDNVVVREVTQEEILQFDAVLNGVDWGWFPDPYAFIRCQYQPGQSRLILFDEFGTNRLSNKDTAKILKTKHGITERDLITCDSAEPKSISDYKSYGLFARGAEKGPDSRRYSFKWLQSLREIVIDPVRCPKALEEFINYEYERDKDGNVLSGYPDINDHFIDAARYATERIWKRRGL